MAAFSTQEVLERLEILWRKLEDEGRYVSSNTVSLAIDEIQRQATNPDRMPKHIALDRSSNSFLFEALVKAQGRDWRRIKREVRKAIKAERLASRRVEKQ